MDDQGTKQEVRKFYNQIGRQKVSEGTYQNAQYEICAPFLTDIYINAIYE